MRLNMIDDEFSMARHGAPGSRLIGGPAPEPAPPHAATQERHAKADPLVQQVRADELDEGVVAVASPSARVQHMLPCEDDDDTVAICALPEDILRSRAELLQVGGAHRLLASSTAEPVPAG